MEQASSIAACWCGLTRLATFIASRLEISLAPTELLVGLAAAAVPQGRDSRPVAVVRDPGRHPIDRVASAAPGRSAVLQRSATPSSGGGVGVTPWA